MNTILCPHCGREVEISQALKHQIEEQVLTDLSVKHKAEIESVRVSTEAKARKSAKEEQEQTLKESQKIALEEKARATKLAEELSIAFKKNRELEIVDEQRDLEMQKKLKEERIKLQDEIGKTVQEKADLEKRDLQKQLDDTKKLLEDAKRKADQKSQQLQGEVLELELEEILHDAFPHDEILPVAKGQKGADIQLVVKTSRGNVCGHILIETKRHKDWDEKWIAKLKEDMRANSIALGVLTSAVLPKEMIKEFGFRDGIYVTSFSHVIPLIEMLRQGMIEVARQKFITSNQKGSAEVLYQYITGHEFRQQMESLAEVYMEQLTQVVKERAAYEKIWKSRESQAHRILMSVTGIYGSLQGKIGNSLPQIKSLELLGGDEDEQQKLLE
jgi:hypothetical protein